MIAMQMGEPLLYTSRINMPAQAKSMPVLQGSTTRGDDNGHKEDTESTYLRVVQAVHTIPRWLKKSRFRYCLPQSIFTGSG